MTPISRSAHGVGRAPKFDKGSVSRGLDDAAAVLGYLGIDEFGAAIRGNIARLKSDICDRLSDPSEKACRFVHGGRPLLALLCRAARPASCPLSEV